MSSREQFEAWCEIDYHNGNPPRFGWAAWRDGDGYKIDDDESELDGMWQAWQAATSAMAAENDALREYRPQPSGASMMEALDAFYERDDVPERGMMAAFEILCCKRPKTPAIDAFLADVRAQGVEMAAQSEQFSTWVQQGLRSFAIGVRKGDNQ